MDRFGLARTIMADKQREIDEAVRRRRLLGDDDDRPSRTTTANPSAPRLRPATTPANPVSGC